MKYLKEMIVSNKENLIDLIQEELERLNITMFYPGPAIRVDFVGTAVLVVYKNYLTYVNDYLQDEDKELVDIKYECLNNILDVLHFTNINDIISYSLDNEEYGTLQLLDVYKGNKDKIDLNNFEGKEGEEESIYDLFLINDYEDIITPVIRECEVQEFIFKNYIYDISNILKMFKKHDIDICDDIKKKYHVEMNMSKIDLL